MLSKDQAESIGSSIVTEARRQEVERKNAIARPISIMYRFPELDTFEPWERHVVLATAAKQAMRVPSVLALWLLSSAVGFVLAYLALVEHKGLAPAFLWAGGLAAVLTIFFHHRSVVRHLVQKQIRSRAQNPERGNPP